MTDVYSSFVLLGYATITHLFLVNLVLGLTILIPILEFIYIREKDEDIKKIMKTIFKFMIITDLFAGVWATWITVFLGGFWPLLTFYATTVLFIPLTIALIGILIALPSIGIYWFTWDKINEKLHISIGIIMAIGAILVPVGFNMIFSFINDPYGMNNALNRDLYAVFMNPLYPDFTLHRIFGGITMIALLLVGIYIYNYNKTGKDLYRKGSEIFLYVSFISLLIESLLGFIYAWELNVHSQYLSQVLFGPFASGISVQMDMFPLFVFFMFLVGMLWLFLYLNSFYFYKNIKTIYPPLILSILSLVTLPVGEFLNDYSRYPYMIITGNSGLPASSFINDIMEINVYWVLTAITISLILIIIYLWLLYNVIIKKRYVEEP